MCMPLNILRPKIPLAYMCEVWPACFEMRNFFFLLDVSSPPKKAFKTIISPQVLCWKLWLRKWKVTASLNWQNLERKQNRERRGKTNNNNNTACDNLVQKPLIYSFKIISFRSKYQSSIFHFWRVLHLPTEKPGMWRGVCWNKETTNGFSTEQCTSILWGHYAAI